MRYEAEQYVFFPLDEFQRDMPSDMVNAAVAKKLLERAECGRKKYGVTMDRTDLTELEWLRHAQEELLDGAVYLEKLIQLKT